MEFNFELLDSETRNFIEQDWSFDNNTTQVCDIADDDSEYNDALNFMTSFLNQVEQPRNATLQNTNIIDLDVIEIRPSQDPELMVPLQTVEGLLDDYTTPIIETDEMIIMDFLQQLNENQLVEHKEEGMHGGSAYRLVDTHE